MAATFDPGLANEWGTAMGEEFWGKVIQPNHMRQLDAALAYLTNAPLLLPVNAETRDARTHD